MYGIEKGYEMKKVLVGVLTVATLAMSTPAMAQHHGHNHGGGWVGPLVGGMVLGAVIQSTRPVYQAPPPPVVIYQQPVYVQQQYCEPRSEVINGVLVQGQYCYVR